MDEQLKKALVKLKLAQKKLGSLSEPIAIVGMACRFPGDANNPEEFWKLLKEGKEGIIEVPPDRWDVEGYYNPDKAVPGKMYTKKGGFLNLPLDMFDPEFFNISPREAEDMDPQQRMLLEVCYEAFENAGIPTQSLKGTDTSVYMGIMYNDYLRLLDQTIDNKNITAYYDSGNLFSATVGRLSYYLGIHGPCVPVDTACSSSLVAIDLACQALHLNQSKIAIAGGVNLTVKPESMIMECKANMLSEDGRCKTFDASADGFSHSEGCGVIILKRLSDAIKDNDRIYSLIVASAVNHGGASSGLTVPNQLAETALLESVLAKAALKPSDISYIEAHGTGTALGDPIEVAAISSVYRKDKTNDLLLGSVKTNIGHTESAAGVAGLLKVVLSLQNQAIPPHLNLKTINPLINLEGIKIPTELTPWKKGEKPRIGAVSSFGFSGINAHLIVQEPPEVPLSTHDKPSQIFTLSAKTEEALNALIEKYRIFLAETNENFDDICYTANNGRNRYKFHIAISAKNIEELKEKLNKREFTNVEDIDFTQFRGKKITLPTYPFQRKKYWKSKFLEQVISQESFDEINKALQNTENKEKTLKEILSNYVKSILKLEKVDPTLGFLEMGMDSVMAVEFSNRVKKGVGERIPVNATMAINYPNIDQLANHILDELKHIEKNEIKQESSISSQEPIAIIGIGCRYPGGINNLTDFWDLLLSGKNGIVEIPKDRWDINEYYDPDKSKPGKMFVRTGGFIDNVDQFDPGFFKISRKEANEMDPQQRIALEVCYEALENANISLESIKKSKTGIFMGVALNDYYTLQTKNLEAIGPYLETGNLHSVLAGRISYTFDLKGPAIAVDSACCTSLVTASLAVNYLRLGLCNLALAGGVNLMLSPEATISCCKAGMLSPEGFCKTFDAKANGYARSEGCGVLVLKRLSDALRDKDNILALIKGSFVNQNGTSTSLTAPNGIAQEDLLKETLKDANTPPERISYIEAHGTGTALGDPIEVQAINKIYGKARTAENPLFLGSVKSNIGHSEVAAGTAGIIKVILSLQHELIPKNLHFNTLNPVITLNSNVNIVSQPTPWSRSKLPRIAAVSSFAFNGTNAHIIIEEVPEIKIETKERPFEILTISAKTQEALDALILKYIQYLETTSNTFHDIACTSHLRDHFEFSIAITAVNKEECIKKLKNKEFDKPGEKISPDTLFKKVTLPNYPFQYKRYWL